MQILIIGGSGRTGKLVIKDALEKGHSVTALVRKAQSLEPQSNLTIVEGSPSNQEDIEKAFLATSIPPAAAIVTLASLRETGSPFAKQVTPPRFLADANANVAAVLKKHGVSKMVILSALGIGSSWEALPLLLKAVMAHSNMKFSNDDHNLVDTEIRSSGMDYVLARAARLEYSDEAKEIRFHGEKGKGVKLMTSITTGTVAKFLVEAAEKDTWNQTAIVIAN